MSSAKASRVCEHGHGACGGGGVLLVEAVAPRAIGGCIAGLLGRRRRDDDSLAVGRVRARADALRGALPHGWRVFAAVHGAEPGIAAALAEAKRAGVRRLVVVPLHPQISDAFSGRAVRELYRALRGVRNGMAIEVRTSYAEDASYVDAVAHEVMHRALERSISGASHELVFVPAAGMEDAGEDRDFLAQMTRTAELVVARLGWDSDRWRIAASSDAVDGSQAMVCGLGRIPGCGSGADEHYGKMLLGLVRRGVHAIDAPSGEPLLRASWKALVERDVGELVMLGASVKGAVCGLARGEDSLVHCSKEEYRALKRPHIEVVQLLESLQGRGLIREGFIWSTCNRFELYAWLPRGDSRAIATLRRELLGERGERHINVLEGRVAWQHLLRTAAGLNSALGGDGEVVDQLEAAVRTAHHAGSAGARSDALLADAREAVGQVRRGTAWGRYDHRYCWVALERLREQLAEGLRGNVLVLGGSSTSCSLVEALGARFGVARERIGLIYRGERNGRLAKRLHSAVSPQRVLSVGQYDDPRVSEALGGADVVFLATDQREPVVHGCELARVRNLGARPIVLVDFNTFGSSEGVPGVEGCTLIDAEAVDWRVQRFNEETLADSAFLRAAADASDWISERVGLAALRRDEDGRRRGARRHAAGALA